MLVELNNTLSNGQILSFQREQDVSWQVLENKEYIWLLMENTVQSVLNKLAPCSLTFPHQLPLNGLITELDQTARILEFGLGGGTNARYIKSQLPNSDISVVEKSPIIIEWFNQYFNPQKMDINLIHQDATDYLEQNNQTYDLIITDLFYAKRSSLSIFNADYFDLLFKATGAGGYAYLNFLPDTDFEPELVKAMLHNAGFEILWSDKIIGFRNWVFLLSKA
ncbi:spermidine synthase [Catenovulum maritimum]|uniref:Methyltransferase domain-containing protein n=1 Tax=Catenovulum maritimum TaxID=1513271 RepID=A0A0J8GZC9_9ALTE|nr:fused MFS/spermidine synthase [Catenovulum maritimum]KMT66078.1 hypothetical protein XM47_06445 [Catenovulum maritimum]